MVRAENEPQGWRPLAEARALGQILARADTPVDRRESLARAQLLAAELVDGVLGDQERARALYDTAIGLDARSGGSSRACASKKPTSVSHRCKW